jgi:hypothetical protein
LLRRYSPAQSKQLGATAIPFALNPAMLIVVIAVFEMPQGISSAKRLDGDWN